LEQEEPASLVLVGFTEGRGAHLKPEQAAQEAEIARM
jgi:hypothetical protein